ncbi:MAG: hypothetical protein COU90_04705 [Candidatus Ryanbacteria bacterium CG10_big_fil_rev_8_21_14_0_10_43_42]|uniref:Amidohydrolase 3 domain-containing protein n=1 Tax=Candidatus Ryanbacteria bacterium CG10_big_fil_rev_8_21_14_0_10_43_42 TaxID=1974864 RepID=A0A2M8KW59_9BACT|nr:MAG: hypothetical protein COU90_04705 [Candidatus Ryanbacteria bacterium CG10_big_fil_rev_8_21_14_0_10_43_42]
MVDILIKNGVIVDGTGKKSPYKGDVAIHNGKIMGLGTITDTEATQIIDASNLFICPGFIDITNHSDTYWTLLSEPSLESMLRQGITTIVGGSCGSSLTPLIRGNEVLGSVQKWVDISTINTNWLSTEEFLQEVSRHPIGVNFATLIGHGTLRRDVMGDKARSASMPELHSMQRLFAEALDDGALGISFGLAFSHGQPATREELITLAQMAADKKRLVTIHLRDEGKDLLPAVNEAISIARGSNARVHIVHLKSLGKHSWETFTQALNLIRSAREEGVPITANVFPYTKTGSLLYALLPSWAREGGKKQIIERIKNPMEKQNLLQGIKELTLHYDKITIASVRETKPIIGNTIADIGTGWGMSPEETLLKILELNNLSVTIFGDTINQEHVELLYKEPFVVFSTDSFGLSAHSPVEIKGDLVHPRSFGATAQFLGTYIREKNLISWEEAVFKMTKAPASLLGFSDKGTIEMGKTADITLINPEIIRDKASYENPFMYPEGISTVIVNGVIAVKNGALTDARAGSVLRAENA